MSALLKYDENLEEYNIPSLYTNQFLIIHSMENPKQTALGRYDGKNVVPLYNKESKPLGVVPRNVGQRFMLEALSIDAVKAPLVIIKGTSRNS